MKKFILYAMMIMSNISVSELEFLRRIKLATVKVNEIVFVITNDLVRLFLTIFTLAMSEFWNRAYIRIPINNLSVRENRSSFPATNSTNVLHVTGTIIKQIMAITKPKIFSILFTRIEVCPISWKTEP
jgi:hypothetical protein